MPETPKVITRYKATAKVVAVEQRFDKLYVSGSDHGAIYREVFKGWFLRTDCGTHSFGSIEPEDIKVGDMLEVTYQRKRRPGEIDVVRVPIKPAPADEGAVAVKTL